MIEGVQVVPFRRIPDERGSVMHMLSQLFAIVINCCTHPHHCSLSTRIDPLNRHARHDRAVRHG